MPDPLAREERSILETLDRVLRARAVREVLDPIAARVARKLHEDAAALLAWEPVPLALFKNQLPAEIRSSWVFVLRAGTTSGAERHPNSIQRMLSWWGDGDMHIWSGSEWRPSRMTPDADAPLDARWITIPVNVWHKPVMGADDWVVVSFHTAPDTELIEERGDPDNPAATQRHTYSEMASEGNRGSR